MSIEAERIHRCPNCGAPHSEFMVRFELHGDRTVACGECEEEVTRFESTIRFTVRRGVEREDPFADWEPDMVIDGAEVYITTRGEAACEVEREEWEDAG